MDDEAAARQGSRVRGATWVFVGVAVCAILLGTSALVATSAQGPLRAQLATDTQRRTEEIAVETAEAVTAREAAAAKLASVRLDHDPAVTGPLGALNTEGAEQACASGRKDAAASDVEAIKAALVAGVPARFPVLNEVPDWQSRLDAAAWAARSEECAAQARAERAAAERKRRQEADKWACLPSNAENGQCSKVYDPDHKLRNGGSDPSQCIHNGKQFCWD